MKKLSVTVSIISSRFKELGFHYFNIKLTEILLLIVKLCQCVDNVITIIKYE